MCFHSNPKEGQCQGMFKLLYNCAHFTCQQGYAQNRPSQASSVHELRTSRCTVGVQRGRGTRDQIANICWTMEKIRQFQRNIYCFFNHMKAFDCLDQTSSKILKEMRIPDHLTCLLRNLYAGKEATVRTRYGTVVWFKWKRSITRQFTVILLI